MAALKDTDRQVRSNAAEELGALGIASPEVLDGLVAALRDTDEYVIREAAKALGKLGNASPEVLDGLLAAKLGNPNYFLAMSVIGALGQLEPASPEEVGGLLAALRNDSCAAEALEKLPTKHIVSYLLTHPEEQQEVLRYTIFKNKAATPVYIRQLPSGQWVFCCIENGREVQVPGTEEQVKTLAKAIREGCTSIYS